MIVGLEGAGLVMLSSAPLYFSPACQKSAFQVVTSFMKCW